MLNKATDYEDHKSGPLEGQERVHEETLANHCTIRVTVTPLAHNPKRPQWQVVVMSPDGKEIHNETSVAKDDHWTVEKLLNWGIDQGKRVAGGHHGAPLDDHHQKTPV
jgi:porphobilinogen deaminase